MGDLKDFYLIGHSLGAYLSGNYAAAYPQHIRKLILVSPPGVSKPVSADEHKDFNKLVKSKMKAPRMAQPLAKYLFKKRYSPFDIQRFLGPKSSYKFMHRVVPIAYKNCPKEE